MSKKLSNSHNVPLEKVKGDVPRLDAASLRALENQIEVKAVEGVPNLRFLDYDFPCNDSSWGVQDFSEWEYFKRDQFHMPPVNMKNSFLWNPDLVQRCKDQRHYEQFIPEPTKTGYRETNQNLARKKRAKRMLAIWRKKPDLARSNAEATVADSEKSNAAGAQSPSRKGRGKRRSVSPPKARRSPSRDR
jgi:hypothetical protein